MLDNAILSGVINVYKPKGLTSYDVVYKIKKKLNLQRTVKIGHTGTLDPIATGVLPICIGRATKISNLIMNEDKEYRAILKLGEKTDSDDITGKVIDSKPFLGSEKDIYDCISQFKGKIEQIPPMFSAIKKDGIRLYELARKGIEIDRLPREININSIKIISIQNSNVEILVNCSKGTYIRTLCADIGEKLNTFAHMIELERTRSGIFCYLDSKKIEEINSNSIIPIQSILSFMPKVIANREAKNMLENGNKIPKYMLDTEINEEFLLYCDDKLYGIYKIIDDIAKPSIILF